MKVKTNKQFKIMFGFVGKKAAKVAAKSGARFVPGLNTVIVVADVATAGWTLYQVAKNINNEVRDYK